MPRLTGINAAQQAQRDKNFGEIDLATATRIIGILGFDSGDKFVKHSRGEYDCTLDFQRQLWAKERKIGNGFTYNDITMGEIDASRSNLTMNNSLSGPKTLDIICFGNLEQIRVGIFNESGQEMLTEMGGPGCMDGTLSGTNYIHLAQRFKTHGWSQIHFDFEEIFDRKHCRSGGYTHETSRGLWAKIAYIQIQIIRKSPIGLNQFDTANRRDRHDHRHIIQFTYGYFPEEGALISFFGREGIPIISTSGNFHEIAASMY